MQNAKPPFQGSADRGNSWDNRDKLLAAKNAICASVLGYDAEIEMMLLCLIAGGHVSALGEPGTAKTLSMKCMARALGGASYKRVQMVPDMMPADILGTEVWNKDSGEFKFVFGPLNPSINLLHADEINRTPPRTQAALLEAMEEGQISVSGYTSHTYKLNEVFMLLATRNPIDTEGTYPLPAAQLDRFAAEVVFRRLSREMELEVARKTAFNRHSIDATTAGALSVTDIPLIRGELAGVHCSDAALKYAHSLVFATRPEACPASLKGVFRQGVSVRAVQWTLSLARVRAYLHGNAYISADDIKFVIPSVLRHRLYIAEQKQLKGTKPEQVIDVLLKEVPIEMES